MQASFKLARFITYPLLSIVSSYMEVNSKNFQLSGLHPRHMDSAPCVHLESKLLAVGNQASSQAERCRVSVGQVKVIIRKCNCFRI